MLAGLTIDIFTINFMESKHTKPQPAEPKQEPSKVKEEIKREESGKKAAAEKPEKKKDKNS